MGKKAIAIEISPGRVAITSLVSGRVVDARELSVNLGGDAAQWRSDLHAITPDVCSAVAELDAIGAHANVWYASPSQAVDLVSIRARSGHDALRAARMACFDAVAYSIDSAVSDSCDIGRDSSGDEPKRHMVAAVDRDDVVSSIAALLAAAGLKLRAICPLAAPIVATMTRAALAADTPVGGVLYIGEQTSYFAVTQDARLLFGRQVAMGTDALVRALTGEIRRPNHAEPLQYTAETAAAMLSTHGIPQREAVIDAEHGLTGEAVMPLLQPVLQRFIVELRQSLRFGLDETLRSDLNVTLTGPGARLPGLAALLEAELGIGVALAADAPPSTADAHNACIEMRTVPLNLLPANIAAQRQIGAIRKWAWAGAAAAIALTAFESVQLNSRITAMEREVDTLQAEYTSRQPLLDAHDRLLTLRHSMNQLRATVHTEMQGVSAFPAGWREIAMRMPDGIALNTIAYRRTPDGSTFTLVGSNTNAGDERTGAGVSDLLSELKGSQLVADVQIGNVQRGAEERFEVSLRIVDWPWYGIAGLLPDPQTNEHARSQATARQEPDS